jgi:hypothetical protein
MQRTEMGRDSRMLDILVFLSSSYEIVGWPVRC